MLYRLKNRLFHRFLEEHAGSYFTKYLSQIVVTDQKNSEDRGHYLFLTIPFFLKRDEVEPIPNETDLNAEPESSVESFPEHRMVWHPYPEERPCCDFGAGTSRFLVTLDDGQGHRHITVAPYKKGFFWHDELMLSGDTIVTAWALLPPPYIQMTDSRN